MRKNIIILSTIVIVVVLSMFYMYKIYKNQLLLEKIEKQKYTVYLENTITGNDLISLINNVINQNEENNVLKDEKGYYIENDTNSIKIKIIFTEFEKEYEMEKIANSGEENFAKAFGGIKFKCKEAEFHKKTGKVKSFIFEQII